jgi:hypothetical protein
MKTKINKLQKIKSNFVRKNLKTAIVLFAAITSFLSCSKSDDDQPIIVPAAGNYRLLSAQSENARYQYDAQGRVNKVYDINEIPQRTYFYNSQNQVEKIIDVAIPDDINEINTILFSYYITGIAPGKINEKTTTITYANSLNTKKIKRVYEYNPFGIIDGSLLYTYDPGTFEYVDPRDAQSYTYNSQGQLTRFFIETVDNYIDYAYDANGNLIEEKRFKTYLRSKIQYTYDDKKNPMYNLLPKAIPEDFTNKNNIKSKITTRYNPDGSVTTTITENGVTLPGFETVNYTYEYNDGGYPTKQITPTATNLFTYEKL